MDVLKSACDGAILCVDLSRGFVAIVDADRFESTLTYNFRNGESLEVRPSSFAWHACKNRNYYYAVSSQTKLSLHRLLTQAPSGRVVDHIDGDTMNNRLCNLRVCTIAENAMNCRKYSRGSSQYKGVRRLGNKWVAQFHWRENGTQRCRSVGSFVVEEEAARAYDRVALEHFGQYSRLNFPQHQPTP